MLIDLSHPEYGTWCSLVHFEPEVELTPLATPTEHFQQKIFDRYWYSSALLQSLFCCLVQEGKYHKYSPSSNIFTIKEFDTVTTRLCNFWSCCQHSRDTCTSRCFNTILLAIWDIYPSISRFDKSTKRLFYWLSDWFAIGWLMCSKDSIRWLLFLSSNPAVHLQNTTYR